MKTKLEDFLNNLKQEKELSEKKMDSVSSGEGNEKAKQECLDGIKKIRRSLNKVRLNPRKEMTVVNYLDAITRIIKTGR